jgi:glycosyltransferase involved in cell wall biosynthesis
MGRSLRGRFSGVVRYTHDLITALAPILGKELVVFLTQAGDSLAETGVKEIRAPFPTPNEYTRAVWEQALVPLQVSRLGIDVYHSPNYIVPAALACPSVVTIHDLAFTEPTFHRLRSRLYLRAMTQIALHKASRVICVSDYTRRRLLEIHPEIEQKVRVIGEGVGHQFNPMPDEVVDVFKRRHLLHAPFVLFVGTLEPRKNLVRLVRAFGLAADMTGAPHLLAIAGANGWKNDPLRSMLRSSPVCDRIRLLGYLSEDDLPVAYSAADVFAYPSLDEGFGLPPLEAMACGTPVLTSTSGAIPEVVGDAALTVDPEDVTALAHGLARVMTDATMRTNLVAAGFRQANQFEWATVAQRTLAVYREAVQ